MAVKLVLQQNVWPGCKPMPRNFPTFRRVLKLNSNDVFEFFFLPVQLAVASESVNTVQIKRNESNCPTGRTSTS